MRKNFMDAPSSVFYNALSTDALCFGSSINYLPTVDGQSVSSYLRGEPFAARFWALSSVLAHILQQVTQLSGLASLNHGTVCMAVTCYRFPSSCIIYLYSDCCRRTCCYVFVTFWRLIPLLSMQSCWGLAGSARAACSCGCCCCWCG